MMNPRIESGDHVENEVMSPERQAHRPIWLEELLNVKFFKSCVAHKEQRKNETNMFCMECVRRICHHCLSCHTLHDTLQVRRYVYQDVVRLGDIQKHLDCSQVQPYYINSSRAVFLNPRPQTKPAKPVVSECVTCNRSLQAPYRYCSIACKVSSNSTPSQPPEREYPDDVKLEEVTTEVVVKLKKSRRKGIPYRSPLR